MVNGGKLFVTGTDVRACDAGIFLDTQGSTPVILVAHDSRFSECVSFGVHLSTSSSGAATGWMSNCTASLCGVGFHAITNFSGGADLTLTNCRATGNTTGLEADRVVGNVTIRTANCVVTQNTTGILSSLGAAVLGTSPGTNLISGNGSGNSTTSNVTLQ
jgi:hypothetical protein